MTNRHVHDERCGECERGAGRNQTACIDAGRVFDSCSDRDCCEDMRVYFSECDQKHINAATAVRAKKAEVISVCIDVEELPFEHGYYSCDLTYYFAVEADAYAGHGCDCACTPVCGVCAFEKKVILYGGEGNVKVFASEYRADACDKQEMVTRSMPHCCVQVAEPVVLDSRVVSVCDCHNCGCGCNRIPESVQKAYGGCFVDRNEDKALLVTIGVFTIVQLVRKVQMLVPMYDYCVPCKECDMGETPCEIFNKMCFPVNEFFPPACRKTE